MHRLLVDTRELSAERPSLTPEAKQHLKVLRPKDGEAVELFDGFGRVRRTRYLAAERTLVADGEIVVHPKPPCGLTLFACVTKGSRWDWTLEKATELGVTRIVPVISDRTIVRLDKHERAAKRVRWVRIVEDAARQSDAVWLPEVVEPVDFADSLALVKETQCFVGALTDPPPRPILAALASATSSSDTAIYVGPEGDFTPAELAALLEIATPVSFGPTVLRAETAAIFGIAVLAASSLAQKSP